MHSHYYIRLTDTKIAIADLSRNSWDVPLPDWTINRINVPAEFNGRGIGSELLRRIIFDADLERSILALDPYASGALDQHTLENWYRRYGFHDGGALPGQMIRRPDLYRHFWLNNPTDLHYRGELAEIGLRATDAIEQQLIRRGTRTTY